MSHVSVMRCREGIHARAGRDNHFLLGVQNDRRAKTETWLGLAVFGGKANMLPYVSPESTQHVQEDIQQVRKKQKPYFFEQTTNRSWTCLELSWVSVSKDFENCCRGSWGRSRGGVLAIWDASEANKWPTWIRFVSNIRFKHGSNKCCIWITTREAGMKFCWPLERTCVVPEKTIELFQQFTNMNPNRRQDLINFLSKIVPKSFPSVSWNAFGSVLEALFLRASQNLFPSIFLLFRTIWES